MPREKTYIPGMRVFLTGGPPTPGVILPSPEGLDLGGKFVLLDGESEPAIFRTSELTPATLTPGRRVFRHAGGAHRFGTIPSPDKIPKALRRRRMDTEEESIVVRWDNGELDVVVKNHLTPIIYETTE